ncbi:hypothetical protein Plhal304r1_c070g0159111 [Plasmopara halstedii]
MHDCLKSQLFEGDNQSFLVAAPRQGVCVCRGHQIFHCGDESVRFIAVVSEVNYLKNRRLKVMFYHANWICLTPSNCDGKAESALSVVPIMRSTEAP